MKDLALAAPDHLSQGVTPVDLAADFAGWQHPWSAAGQRARRLGSAGALVLEHLALQPREPFGDRAAALGLGA